METIAFPSLPEVRDLAYQAQLAEVDDTDPDALDDAVDQPGSSGSGEPVEPHARPDEQPEQHVSLAEQRRGAVLAVLRACGATRVGDLGCGEGTLLSALLATPRFTEVVGVDVSFRALNLASRRLRLDRMPERQRDRLRLFQSSLTYRDDRLARLDAAVLMEVVEHLDPSRLPAMERCVFGVAAPGTVVVTTPNVEYNVRFTGMAPGARRHRDHRFEWTRAEFTEWADRVAARYDYQVHFLPVGVDDPEVGPPTQLAVFTRTVPAATPDRPEQS